LQTLSHERFESIRGDRAVEAGMLDLEPYGFDWLASEAG
jgi:hypothetical protein